MIEKINKNDWPLFRMIIAAYPEINIFTRQAKKTTALGPIMVATAANKLWGWRAEVIDENNYRGPRDKQGLPDHLALQKENPAAIVGFYCGLTSTIERVWEVAEFYHQQGVTTIAGGWHAHYCPEEMLRNNIDVVIHGDGEPVVRQLLDVLQKNGSLEDIPGISFMKNGQMKSNLPETIGVTGLDLKLTNLPFPDFGLLKYAKMKIYPIGRIKGCSMNCEFCSVKGKPRWASAQHLFDTVKWLVETRRARNFFIVDDRSEEDPEGTLEFFRMISEKYGNRLIFTVQIRLETAKNIELLEIMKKAGVRVVCVGYESPIDEDLRAMRKGYPSSNMLEWTKVLRRYFWIHGMFIVGYPAKEKKSSIGAKETFKRFRKFIRKASPDTTQILLPVPILGSALRQRLEQEGRIFPMELVSWEKYDGSYICFKPDNMTVWELQELAVKLTGRFYNRWSFVRIPLRIFAFLFVLLYIRGWEDWYRGWKRDITQCGGHFLIRRWLKRQKDNKFIERLKKY